MIDELSRECDIRLIPIGDNVIKKMLSSSDAYSATYIPTGTYKGQDQDIKTIGVKSVLVTSDSMSDELIEQLTRMLFEKTKELQYSTSLNLQLNEDFAVDGIPIPFHSGAITYYESNGIDVNTQ